MPTVEPWRDPQVYLSRTALGKSPHSHYDVTDFVTGMVEEEVVVGGNGFQQVVLKSGPKKPKLENVTLAQWCVANNAILYRLVCESKLHQNNMLDYISYSTKICELVQRFTLVSVLLYDRNYRQLQAQNGFRWGTDVPHLQNVHLIPRIPRSNNNQPQKGGPSQPSRTQQNPGPLTLDGRVICKLFNTKAGCHFKECRYVHQCSHNGCHQAHSATTHYQEKKLKSARSGSPGGLCLTAWEEELENDEDRDFILTGLQNGFDIIDSDACPAVVECENHMSARPGSPYYKEATAQVLKEIEMGHYKVVSDPPDIISPIAVIPKPDGGVRLIHDCSRPDGLAVMSMIIALLTGSKSLLRLMMQQN